MSAPRSFIHVAPASGARRGPEVERARPLTVQEMALDTLGNVLRILGEHALDQEQMEAAIFTRLSEQWVQHVLVAAAPPTGESTRPAAGSAATTAATAAAVAAGAVGAPDAPRDWGGVREFVRAYCRNSTAHAQTVIGDLRQVVWVFIQNLNQTVALAAEADGRITGQLGRLEALAQSTASTSELKREVLSTVVAVASIVEERKRTERARVEDLGTRVRLLGQELETVRKESEVDPLTRLYNRKAFDAYVSRTVELAHAFEQSACLMLVDLDRFKPINDTFGHPTGDAVLSQIADVLSRIFLRKNDLVARYGGDEMAVVLRETGPRDAMALGERLLRAVRALRIEREGTSFGLTVSIGVAGLRAGDTPASWLERCDRALYEAKNGGRDRVVVTGAG